MGIRPVDVPFRPAVILEPAEPLSIQPPIPNVLQRVADLNERARALVDSCYVLLIICAVSGWSTWQGRRIDDD